MITPPTFASPREHVARLADVGFWWPYVAEVLGRHGLLEAGHEPVAGHAATYPTFIYGDVVVKLFGRSRAWHASYTAEQAALGLVASDPRIVAPRMLGTGRLFPDLAAPWPYLITARVSGVAARSADLSAEERLSLASELGRQVRCIHALAPSVATKDIGWSVPNVAAAAGRSSLPLHLIAQIDGYLARLGAFDRVFVHGDLVASHVYFEDGHVSGIIDWGDAMVTDRHYEIVQIFRDTLACDKALLRAFLDASDWPVGKDFPRRALGLALHRQAIGGVQHHTMDVFEPIAALLRLGDIGTLDELATTLFAI